MAAAIALAGCAGVQNKMPDWVPGSGAVKVTLSGDQEVPPVRTAGSASGSFRLAENGTLTGSVTVKGFESTAAHIHLGKKGRNGPVIVPLVRSGDTYSVPDVHKLSTEQAKAFREGGLYVNVHSRKYRGGEVRAQIEP